jgi:IclR family transcriptional regulator, pca regulon regulatory protein
MKSNRSLARGLMILRTFNEAPRPTLTEISTRVGLTKATCLRFLKTLQDEGYVDYDESLKRYQLRPLVLELGYAALASLSMPTAAVPEMQALADQTGGAVNLSVLDGTEIVLLARTVAQEEKRKLVTMNLHVGMRLPAHCTAMGRILLGISKPDVAAFVAGMQLAQLTNKTLVDSDKLSEAIMHAASRGYEIIEDQLSLGYGAVGVPLIIPNHPPFALAVSVSTLDNSHDRLERVILPLLQQTADRLSRAFAGAAKAKQPDRQGL